MPTIQSPLASLELTGERGVECGCVLRGLGNFEGGLLLFLGG